MPGVNLNEMNEKLDEYKESLMRRSNIIIFKVDESLKEKPEERKVEDMQIINSLCTLTDASHESVQIVPRLRKKLEGEKPRSHRVVFEDEKAKNKLMANLKRLGPAEDKFKKMSIVHDLTQKERQKSREKWEEAKEKKQSPGIGGREQHRREKNSSTY